MSDLAELMSRDPLNLSSQDLDAIILRLRQARAQYKLGAKGAGNPKVTTKPKKTISTIDLGALGLLDQPAVKPTIDLAALGLLAPTGETENGNG